MHCVQHSPVVFYKIKIWGDYQKLYPIFPYMRERENFQYCCEVTGNTAVVNMNKPSLGGCRFVVITWEWFWIIILFLLALT